MKREDHLQFRETLLQRRESDMEARTALADQQDTKIQAESAQLFSERQDMERNIAKQNWDIGDRTHSAGKREAAVASREKCLEQLRMSVHEQLNVSMDEPDKPCTSWGGSSKGDWSSVLELAVQVKMFVEDKVFELNNNEFRLADLNRMSLEVEEKAKKVIFGGGEITLGDIDKIAAALRADDKRDSRNIVDAMNIFTYANDQRERHRGIPAATSTEDVKPATWNTSEAEKPGNTFEAKKFPASTPVKDCSGKWGCGCTTCRERDEIWKAHKPTFKNHADGRLKCEMRMHRGLGWWLVLGM